MIKQTDLNLEADEIYSTVPNLNLTNGICVRPEYLHQTTGVPVAQEFKMGLPSSPKNQLTRNHVPSIVHEYSKSLHPDKSDVSAYVVEVSLLRSSKIE